MATPIKRSATKRSPVYNAGLLSGDDIKRLGIVAKNYSNDYEPTSYDLRLGNEFIVPKEPGNRSTENLLELQSGQKIVIKPFSSVIVSTFEVLRLPDDVVGRFNLKIGAALKGLFVQMGTQVEPGYHGILAALVHNVSSRPVEIVACSDEFFTIEFFYVGSTPRQVKPKKQFFSLRELVGKDPSFMRSKGLLSLAETFQERTERAEKAAKTASEAAEKLSLNYQTLSSKFDTEIKRVENVLYTRRQVVVGTALSLLIALITSAVAPAMIGLATNWMVAPSKPTRELVDGEIEKVRADIVSLSQEVLQKAEGTSGEIEALKSELAALANAIEKIAQEQPIPKKINDTLQVPAQ